MHLSGDKPAPPSLYPKELRTLGAWIRKTRLDRGLTQEQVGVILGVTECCVVNWELHHSKPELRLRAQRNLGSDDYPPDEALLCDRQDEKLFIGGYDEVAQFGLDPTE